MMTSPLVERSSALMMPMSVLLPQPEGPMRATDSPAAMASDTPLERLYLAALVGLDETSDDEKIPRGFSHGAVTPGAKVGR